MKGYSRPTKDKRKRLKAHYCRKPEAQRKRQSKTRKAKNDLKIKEPVNNKMTLIILHLSILSINGLKDRKWPNGLKINKTQ